jgi:hypothetical protein
MYDRTGLDRVCDPSILDRIESIDHHPRLPVACFARSSVYPCRRRSSRGLDIGYTCQGPTLRAGDSLGRNRDHPRKDP